MWKDVKGYEKIYMVNEYGDVLSLESVVTRSDGVARVVKQRLLSHHFSSCGYPMVKMSKDGKSKNIAVHILVATAFCDNPYGYKEFNHKDCNRANCEAKNLEWITHKKNVKYSHELGHYMKPQFQGSENPNSKPVHIDTLSIRFDTMIECSKFLINEGYTDGSVLNACSCIRKAINSKSKYLGLEFSDLRG